MPPPPQPPDVTTGPTQRPARRERSKGSAFVTVAQRSSPNVTARRGSVVTYTIVVVNRSDGGTSDVTVALPINVAAAQLVDVAFSSTEARVSAASADSLVFETGAVGSDGDVVTATVRLAVLPSAADGDALSGALTFSGRSGTAGGDGHSNAPAVVVGGDDVSVANATLDVAPSSAPAGSTHTFSSALFAPGKPVTLWYNAPGGVVVGVTPVVSADAEGRIKVLFTTTELAPGSYTMVARGGWSELIAVGAFEVSR